MVKFACKTTCGNAPKKRFLLEFNKAFAEAAIDFMINSVSDNFEWVLVGDKSIQGKENFKAALETMKAYPSKEMILMNIITHGREAAVQGELLLNDGSRYSFADIYTFKNAKGTEISRLVSHVIKLE